MKLAFSKLLTLALLVMLATSTALAYRGSGQQFLNRPGRREIKVYFDANVLPVLRQQRQKMEPQLVAYRT